MTGVELNKEQYINVVEYSYAIGNECENFREAWDLLRDCRNYPLSWNCRFGTFQNDICPFLGGFSCHVRESA